MEKDTATTTLQQNWTLIGQEGKDWIRIIIPMDFIEVHKN